jgi:hypothetical protein
MSKTRDTGYLANVVQYTDQAINFVSGSTTLMSISSSGAVTITGELSGSDAANALLLSGTGSVGFTTTGSFNAASSSFSTRTTQIESVYATTGSNSFRATQSITGSLTVTGQIIAQTLNVQQVTSSIVYSSGSNTFGCDLNSRQTFTGSMYVTGSCHMIYGNVAIGSCATSASLMVKSSGANGIFLACDKINSDVSTRLLFENCRNQYAIFNSGGNLLFNYGATLVETSGTNGFYMSSDGSVSFQSKINGTIGYFANCIGIGISSPSTLVHAKTTGDGYNMLTIEATGGDAGIALKGGSAGSSVGGWTIQSQNGGSMIFVDRNSTPIERMRITSTGNVGINTTNFGEKLNVGCGGAMAFQNTCNCQKWHIQYNSNDGLNFVESSVADFRLFLKAGGFVGIGTGAPCSTLTSRGTDLTSFTTTSFGNLFLQGGAYDSTKIQTIDFGSTTYGVPMARIGVKICSNGTHMMLGTSNDYATGITNCGIYVNYVGNIGAGTNPADEKFVIYGGSGHNNVFLRLKTDGTHGTKPSIYFDSGLVGTNRCNKVQLLGGYNSPTGGQGGNFTIYTADSSETLQMRMCIDSAGQVTIQGALAKGSGSFRICHPLSSKVNTHALVHSFIEGPNADLMYSGHTKLISGVSCINIDCVSRMTEGTFEALNRCVRIFTTNESSWSAVRGRVCGNIVIIESQDSASEDEISWMVIGERQDQHMFDTEWTDNEGRVITEPEITIVEDTDIVA